ncbi:beta-ketoacyl synthase N-terminal-like domain-containing protein [Streptomyces sp. CAU 1734]|uniref:beta-ketoacyl synthase N-terminal-like domain-containing protein n=1 Tax=Streptomyces sp. CAU 1734 TaxID=3140360 RepID=UPI003261C343
MTRDYSPDIAVTGMSARWRAASPAGERPHRLMLEAVWRALEDSGSAPYREARTTGVYAAPAAGGGAPGRAARRIAYELGLTGPAQDFPAAGSSALVAVQAAVQALLTGECDQSVVVAGGTGGAPDDDGHTAGAACVVLRRLSELRAEGPQPHGVIRGAGGGRTGVIPGGPARGGEVSGSGPDDTAGLAALVEALLVVREGMTAEAGDALPSPGSPEPPGAGAPPRRARVGDARAHVLVEQAPPLSGARPAGAGREHLIVLSAADPEALSRSAARLAAHLTAHAPLAADVARTLATGRARLTERLAVTGRSSEEIARRLTDGTGVRRGRSRRGRPAPVVFLLPDGDTPPPGAAGRYAAVLPGFADALDACRAAFGRDPGAFALQYAAATALTGLGVRPAALVGRGLGGIVAAVLAGEIGLEEAARLVTARGPAGADTAATPAAVARRHPDAVALEFGPAGTLSAMASAAGLTAVALSPGGPHGPAGADEGLLSALGALWTLGQPLDLARLCAGGGLVHLPGYPFAGPALGTPREGGPVPAAGTEECAVREFMVATWCELLRRSGGLTGHSDFFARGGDSLLVTRLARRICQEFGVKVTAHELSRRNLGDQVALVRQLCARRRVRPLDGSAA